MVEITTPDGKTMKVPEHSYYASKEYRDARSDAIRRQADASRRFASGQTGALVNVNWGNQFRNLPR